LASLGPGSRVADFLIKAEIGRGGMGTVFYARHEATGQEVALKVITLGLADDQSLRDRFLREARELDVLKHPHVIPVHFTGDADGVLYIATRYVRSGDLADLLRRNGGPLPARRVVMLIEQVASALDAAHSAGRVHRDVKPGNILVEVLPGRRDHAYLSDFGLVKVIAATKLTVTGTVAGGTPDYMAPEQVLTSEVDGRADQYSLACVAFELLTGQAPFPRPTPSLVYQAHQNAPVPSASAINRTVSPAVDQVLRRAMAKKPGGRYHSCLEFAASLGIALTPPGYTPTRGAGQPPTVTAQHFSRQHEQTRRPEPAASESGRVIVPRRRWGAVLAAVGTAVVVLTAVIFVVPRLDHPNNGGNPGGTANTGSTANTGPTSGSASLRWSYTTGINLDADQTASATSSPTVVNGVVYDDGDNGDVYAFNAATGHVDLHYVTASPGNGPTVANGTIYVGSDGNGVYAVNAASVANMSTLWSYTSGAGESAPVVVDGTVYVVGLDGYVRALDAANGHLIWSHSIGYAGTGVAVADGLVYVSSIGDIGYVYALDAATGDLRWTFKTEDARESTPAVADGTVYVGCGNGPGSNGTVFAINAVTGQSRWSYTTGNGTAAGVDAGAESSPAVDGDVVYVGSDNGAVYALNTANGHLDWSYTTGGSVVSTPAVDGGIVYVGSEDDKVYAFNAATGHLIWSYTTGNVVVSNLAAAGDIVYAASDDGKLYALATVK
jgi:outer membrane protein assembly factor BamB